MANWLYTLSLKDLLANEGPEFDYDTHSIKTALEAEKRIRALIKRVEKPSPGHIERRKGDLALDLDGIADMFHAIGTDPDALTNGPADEFNEALEYLYSIGDDGHRIWTA